VDDLSPHAARNRAIWNADAPNWVAAAREAWESPTPWWGMWHMPEEELRILPDVAGLDVLDPATGARGSSASARARWGSTSPRSS
jgi:hypothetical protein